jgi:hypothetical protein
VEGKKIGRFRRKGFYEHKDKKKKKPLKKNFAYEPKQGIRVIDESVVVVTVIVIIAARIRHKLFQIDHIRKFESIIDFSLQKKVLQCITR